MTDLEIDDLARKWIVYQEAWERADGPCNECDDLQWVYNFVDETIRERPEEAWKLVLAVRRLDQSEMIMQILAASVFEDLMSAHGAVLIDRVEVESKRDPSFVGIIRGSYRVRMPDDIWARLQSLVKE